MAKSSFVGCCIGRSPGLAPLRILSTCRLFAPADAPLCAGQHRSSWNTRKGLVSRRAPSLYRWLPVAPLVLWPVVGPHPAGLRYSLTAPFHVGGNLRNRSLPHVPWA